MRGRQPPALPGTPASSVPHHPMNAFQLHNGQLHAEDVSLAQIAARFGTPCYVYSRGAITEAWREFAQACAGRRVLVCYALKANSNLAIIDLLAREQAGFDIVSAGELARVLAAGGSAERIVFSGVGKSGEEIREALRAGVRCFNVESSAELERLDRIAGELGRRAPVSREQRRVEVEARDGWNAQQLARQNLPVGHHHDHIGPQKTELLDHAVAADAGPPRDRPHPDG